MYSLKICELYFHRAIQNYKKQSPVNIKDGELCHNIFRLKAVNYTAQKKPADLVTFTEEIVNGNFIFCAVLLLQTS